MELHYNRDLLKSVLTMLKEHDTECSRIEAEEIVIFNSKYAIKEEPPPALSTDPKYFELSSGDFTVHTNDERLKERFDAIRQAIHRNRKEG
jgi:hypothetical protein